MLTRVKHADGTFYKRRFPSSSGILHRSSAWIKVGSLQRTRFEILLLCTRQNREKTSSSIHRRLSSGMHQSLTSCCRRRLPRTRLPWNERDWRLLYSQARRRRAGLPVRHLVKRATMKIRLPVPVLLRHRWPHLLRPCLLHAQRVKRAQKKILNSRNSRHARSPLPKNLRESQRKR